VSGVGEGEATITATSEDQSGSASVRVVPVPVASVAVSPATLEIEVGATGSLSAATFDREGNELEGRSVAWSSSNEEVATISAEGVVSGVGEGEATITATSEDQSGSASVRVVPVPVASVAVAPATLEIEVGATGSLSAATFDREGNELEGRSVAWSSSDETVATVSQEGVVTGVAGGAATITATSEGQSGSASVTVACSGTERNFSYMWSLEREQVTVTNLNQCGSLYIWATTTPLCSSCENTIVKVSQWLKPDQTLVMDAGVPAELSWKPEVIYSTESGESYAYHPEQTGTTTDHHFELLLLDFSETYQGRLEGFAEMYSIDPDETRRGDCEDFSWIDRANGDFRIDQSTSGQESYCFVGNIRGYTSAGEAVWLPALRYFVTTESDKQP